MKGVAEGRATIRATAGDAWGTARITVIPDPSITNLVAMVEYIRADVPGDWRYARISALRMHRADR